MKDHVPWGDGSPLDKRSAFERLTTLWGSFPWSNTHVTFVPGLTVRVDGVNAECFTKTPLGGAVTASSGQFCCRGAPCACARNRCVARANRDLYRTSATTARARRGSHLW